MNISAPHRSGSKHTQSCASDTALNLISGGVLKRWKPSSRWKQAFQEISGGGVQQEHELARRPAVLFRWRKSREGQKKEFEAHVWWKMQVTSANGWMGVVIRAIWLAGWQRKV